MMLEKTHKLYSPAADRPLFVFRCEKNGEPFSSFPRVGFQPDRKFEKLPKNVRSPSDSPLLPGPSIRGQKHYGFQQNPIRDIEVADAPLWFALLSVTIRKLYIIHSVVLLQLSLNGCVSIVLSEIPSASEAGP